jgi:succinoglycan biosynthesis transport protein ExoP
MTTLPQTAPLRLPRPASSTPLAIPAPVPYGAIAGYSQPPSVSQMSGADVWRVLRSNFWLIVLMTLLGAGAGYAGNYWLKIYHSRYTATGILEVVSTSTDEMNRTVTDNASLLFDIKTHAALLTDPSLFNRVLESGDSEIRNTPWFKSFNGNVQEAKEDLHDNFEVIMSPESRLLRVSMTYSDPKSCQTIVNVIVDEYLKEQRDINRNKEYGRHQDLQNHQAAEEGALQLANSDINDLEMELNSAGVSGTQGRINTNDMELEALLNNRIKLEEEAQATRDEYNQVLTQINVDQDPPEVSQLIYADPEVANYRERDNQLQLALQEAQNDGPENPTVKHLKASEQLVQQKLDQAISEARVRYRTAVTEKIRELLGQKQTQIDAFNKRMDALRAETGHLNELVQRLLQKQQDKASIESRLRVIQDQLDQIDNVSVKRDFAGVDWAAKPILPETPSFPKLIMSMTLAITLGLALALGIAFLRELMDTSIRSPRDISRVGNMNLLGMVPHEDDDPQSAGARLPVVIFEAPHSMMAEQLRQVRTRLQHSSSLDTTRSILITSPSPGDGKSTIACNLASGLALNGRRILLVDANFRRPELHRVFNLSNEQGFSDVLSSLDQFEQAVQETQVPNLYILPSGPKPTNATELLESQLLTDFIERSLEEFDHVIFDSGPILFVSETVALAPRVDGVVSVVRARANTRGMLSRMRDSLRQVKAEHLGVVLNAVRAQGGGYYGRNIRTYYEYQNGGRAA